MFPLQRTDMNLSIVLLPLLLLFFYPGKSNTICSSPTLALMISMRLGGTSFYHAEMWVQHDSYQPLSSFDEQLKFYGLFAVFQVACTGYGTQLTWNGSILRKTFKRSLDRLYSTFETFTFKWFFSNKMWTSNKTRNIDIYHVLKQRGHFS